MPLASTGKPSMNIEKEIGVDEFLRDIRSVCSESGTSLCRSEGFISRRPMGRKGRWAFLSSQIV